MKATDIHGRPARLFGLLGHPLGHSFSQKFFRDKFLRENIDADYINFDIDDIRNLRRIVDEYPRLCGLNVTIPYKQAVVPLLDDITAQAHGIGAVNVIVINREADGTVRLIGHNTDCPGFGRSIDVFADAAYAPESMRALVLGTGGASRAVTAALKIRGIEPTLVSRTPAEGRLTYQDISAEVMDGHRIIVNCTPLGTYPAVDTYPPIPYELLTPRHICIDLVYNPSVTAFMRKAAEAGCAVKNGLDMLHEQALLSWHLWNGGEI